MQHGDAASSYYHGNQSDFQNPNPNSYLVNPPVNAGSLPPADTTGTASAPPVFSGYSSDYSSYSSVCFPYSLTSDHAANPPLTLPPNSHNSVLSAPSHQQHSFPHLKEQPPPNYGGYHLNQTSFKYDHSGAVSYTPGVNSFHSSNSLSPALYKASILSHYNNLHGKRKEFRIYGARADSIRGGLYKLTGGNPEAYEGRRGESEPFGRVIFDDYGRPISFSNGKLENGSGSLPKTVTGIPKTVVQEDVTNGVQKFRVKLLSEGLDQSDFDILCQISLNGIRLLNPSTGHLVKIFPYETVTRCGVLDSCIFVFWVKSSSDNQSQRIRLKSNSYTSNNILDTVTAAMFQVKELSVLNAHPHENSEQPLEKKRGFADWMNMKKPKNEEKDHWVPDEAVKKCRACETKFGTFTRRHHCRNCGDIFCDNCTLGRIALTADEDAQPVRVCDACLAEVTQRFNAKERAGKVSGLQSHEDLAKKLEDVLKTNRRASTGSMSNRSRFQIKEVECPTCTVHLKVEIPSSGSRTIECNVCHNLFLVKGRR